MTALYYPFINFRDPKWVRVAAVYWDQIYRIVPHLDEPNDPQFIRDLRIGGDGIEQVIHNYNPYKETQVVAQRFTEFVDREVGTLQGRYNVDNAANWGNVDAMWLGPNGRPEDKLAQIYTPKLGETLKQKLIDAHLAQEINFELVGMHPELAFVYMSELASQIGRDKAMTPATENNLAQHGLVLSADRLFAKLREEKTQPSRQPGELEIALLSLTMDAFMPKGWEEMTAKQLLQAKQEARTPVDDLRKWMQELIKQEGGLEKVDDPRMVQERLKSIYNRNIKGALTELHKTQLNNKALIVAGGLTLSFAIPATMTSVGIPMTPEILQFAGGSLSVAGLVAAKEKMDSDLMKKQGAFLLKLNQPRKGLLAKLKRR